MDLTQRRSGVLMHVTSLPGPHGIGDFGHDAYRFVDWLHSAGQSLWQWLPISPIGPGDSPYQGPSAFAGSPLMVAFEPLIERGWMSAPALPAQGFSAQRVDFRRVIPWKIDQLKIAARGFFSRASAEDKNIFGQWCVSNAEWLDDYALFTAIHSAHDGRPFWEWEKGLRERDSKAIAAAKQKYADDIQFWMFVQWCFDQQVHALKKYANDRGVYLVGDLPIFIADNSADVWSRPDLYFLDENFQPSVVAGVPPDDLGPQGQRWGNPLYRWDRMAKENYAWWTARVKRALSSADIFRIDHFRGFAGYYEIPASSPTAMQGQWLPGPGKPLFDAIAKALGPLPIIAEDLGLITPDVIELREGCGYPGMKILQFGFGGDGSHEFLPHNYPCDTFVYTGTHDNDTARGWWNNAPEKERKFCGTYLAANANDVHWAMMRAASNSVANNAVFPMQDVLGLGSEDRMNTPGVGDGNWSWRFEWKMLPQDTTRALGMMAATSGRAPMSYLNQ
jgi:4-alpha-glucanotransferase